VASNVYVAAGHNMLGMSMAPATGQMIAQILNDHTPTIDPEPYRLAA
jgi:D-amino-acid dehydrogenase